MAAREADAQVQPDVTRLQAVLAAGDLLRQLGDLDRVGVGAARAHLPFFPSSGSQMWKVVPASLVSNVSEPPWRCSTMRRAVSSPIPVPLPGGLVVKNGSKMRERASSGMPCPLSAMSTLMQPLSALVLSVITPSSSPSAQIALSSRFVQTWLSSEPCIVICGSDLS